MDQFPCNQCGLCCKLVGLVIDQLKENGFPYNQNKKGECEKLVDDKCSVYETRPSVCRIDEMQLSSGKSKSEYYKDSINVCNQLKKTYGKSDFINHEKDIN